MIFIQLKLQPSAGSPLCVEINGGIIDRTSKYCSFIVLLSIKVIMSIVSYRVSYSSKAHPSLFELMLSAGNKIMQYFPFSFRGL